MHAAARARIDSRDRLFNIMQLRRIAKVGLADHDRIGQRKLPGGLGLRVAAGRYASVQVDYGAVVKEGVIKGAGNGKLHVRVGLAY